MVHAIAVILSFQLAGEVLARLFGLPVPGPVLGLVLLLLALARLPRLVALVRPLAQGLLGHLALLFVPAGVGVVGHVATLGAEGLGILAALLGSTVLAIAVGAMVFRLVARLTGDGGGDAPPDMPPDAVEAARDA